MLKFEFGTSNNETGMIQLTIAFVYASCVPEKIGYIEIN